MVILDYNAKVNLASNTSVESAQWKMFIDAHNSGHLLILLLVSAGHLCDLHALFSEIDNWICTEWILLQLSS